VIGAQEWYRVLLLSQSLDNLGITLGECLGRTRWSSPLDSTTYLYYFTSSCTLISTQSHVLPEHSMITWQGHVIWLSNLPCYLYLDLIVRLDVRDQMCGCVGNSFLPGALITLSFRDSYLAWGVIAFEWFPNKSQLHFISVWQRELISGTCRAGMEWPRVEQSYSSIRIANSWAGIKPTAPLSVLDKENSIEFPLNLLHYIYNYYRGYTPCLPQSSCPSANFFVTCCDHQCDCCHTFVTLWLVTWYFLRSTLVII